MPTTPRHVLVIEDSDEDWDTVLEAARGVGCAERMHRMSNGEECLAVLQSGRARHPLVDAPLGLVLLDLNLPGMDGRDVLQTIKGDEALMSLPVVVCSTSLDPRDIADCYLAGANAFHVKPMQHGAHLRCLHDLLAYWLGTVRTSGVPA